MSTLTAARPALVPAGIDQRIPQARTLATSSLPRTETEVHESHGTEQKLRHKSLEACSRRTFRINVGHSRLVSGSSGRVTGAGWSAMLHRMKNADPKDPLGPLVAVKRKFAPRALCIQRPEEILFSGASVAILGSRGPHPAQAILAGH